MAYLLLGLIWLGLLLYRHDTLMNVFGGSQIFFIVITILLFVSFSSNKFIKRLCIIFSYLLLLLVAEMSLYSYELSNASSNITVRFGNLIFALLLYCLTLAGFILIGKKVAPQNKDGRLLLKNLIMAFAFPYLLIVLFYCLSVIIGTGFIHQKVFLLNQPLYSLITLFFSFLGLVVGGFYLAIFLKPMENGTISEVKKNGKIHPNTIFRIFILIMGLGLLIESLRGYWVPMVLILVIPVAVSINLIQLYSINPLSANSMKNMSSWKVQKYWKFAALNILLATGFIISLTIYMARLK